MARIAMGLAPNFSAELDYNAGNGRVTSLVVTNATGGPAYAEAELTDGRVFGQVFGQGETLVNFPNNVVSVAFDAQGEATFVGLARVSTRVPA